MGKGPTAMTRKTEQPGNPVLSPRVQTEIARLADLWDEAETGTGDPSDVPCIIYGYIMVRPDGAPAMHSTKGAGESMIVTLSEAGAQWLLRSDRRLQRLQDEHLAGDDFGAAIRRVRIEVLPKE